MCVCEFEMTEVCVRVHACVNRMGLFTSTKSVIFMKILGGVYIGILS